jgi:mannosyltransferase
MASTLALPEASPATARPARLGERLSGWLVVAVPAVAALIVGGWALSARQLWRDELVTLRLARMPVEQISAYVEKTDAVNAPYYYFMHFWTAVFGDSEFALRLPSLLGFALAAGSAAAIGRRLFTAPAGVVAGLLLAVLPATSRYAQEARVYGLAVGLTALAYLLLLVAVERPTWLRWAAYTVTMGIAGALHLMVVLALFAHAAYVAMSWRRDRRILLWLPAAAIAVVPVLLVYAQSRSQTGQISWIGEPTLQALGDQFITFADDPRASAVVFGCALLGIWPLSRSTVPLAVWAIVPAIVLYLASPIQRLFLDRYLLFCTTAFALLAAAAIDRIARAAEGALARVQRFALPAVVVALTLAIGLDAHIQMRGETLPTEPDVRGAANVIAADFAPGDTIAFQGTNAGFWRQAVDYYLPAGMTVPTRFTARRDTPPEYAKDCGPGLVCEALDGRIWLLTTDGADPFAGVENGLREKLENGFTADRSIKLHMITATLLVPKTGA